MIRSQLAEFGIVLAKGIQLALRLAGQLVEGAAPNIPPLAVTVIVTLAEQLRDLSLRIAGLDKDLNTWARDNEVLKRLQTIPGFPVMDQGNEDDVFIRPAIEFPVFPATCRALPGLDNTPG